MHVSYAQRRREERRREETRRDEKRGEEKDQWSVCERVHQLLWIYREGPYISHTQQKTTKQSQADRGRVLHNVTALEADNVTVIEAGRDTEAERRALQTGLNCR